MLYKIVASRITLREFWFESKSLVWVGLIVKLFKVHLRGSTDDLAVDSIEPFAVDAARIAPDTTARFGPALQQLAAAGFGPAIWYDQEDPYQATRNTFAVLRHASGRAFARVQQRTNFGRVPAKIKFFTTFVSAVPGGYLVTGNGKCDLAWPKTHDTVRLPKAPLPEVWARHQARMTAAVQTIDPFALAFAAAAHHESLAQFHVARGVFQPLGEEEFASFSAPVPAPVRAGETFADAAVAPPVAGGGPHAPLSYAAATLSPAAALPEPDLMERATLNELQRLQNRAVNWPSFILLLALSCGLFLLQSRHSDRSQGWQQLAIIVGVLLFHELGHFVTMKAFGYRNMRMFFIPGLGAAVSGQHYNAPAWKKILVSLAGPLPGIAAGTALVIAFAVTRNDLLYQIGFLELIINALNLIPILPLDGGRVAHAALFARHPKLDVGFRLVAALLLIGISLLVPGMTYLLYLAVASLAALPLANTLAVIVGELRGETALGLSPDSQSIPQDTARVILAKLRQRMKRNLNVKTAAQHVASVFESLNARPPSVGPTLGLLSLHAGGFVVALVVGIAAVALHDPAIIARLRQQAALKQLALRQPMSPVDVSRIGTAARPAGPVNTLVLHLKDAAAADAAAAGFQGLRPVTRFGQTLFVPFAPQEAAQQKATFAAYEKTADDLFVETADTPAHAHLTLRLPSDAAGQQVMDALQAYLIDGSWGLTPPWADEAEWPAAQRGPQTRLRRLVLALQTGARPDLHAQQALWKQIDDAQRHGDTAEVKRLQDQIKADHDRAEADLRNRLQSQYGHGELISAWAAAQKTKGLKERRDRMKRDVAPYLGVWPGGQPNDALVRSGYVFTSPLLGTELDCQFYDTPVGLAALTRWLYAQGATDVQYRLSVGNSLSEDGDAGDEDPD